MANVKNPSRNDILFADNPHYPEQVTSRPLMYTSYNNLMLLKWIMDETGKSPQTFIHATWTSSELSYGFFKEGAEAVG